MSDTHPKNKRWEPGREAFDRFLSHLDPEREAAGFKHERLRLKLIHYFEWRGSRFAEDHADEAINRVIRKLEAGEAIRDVSSYVFGVARIVLQEAARRERDEQTRLGGARPRGSQFAEENPENEQQGLDCLRGCLDRLPVESRNLIVEYYQAESPQKNRLRIGMAERLRIPLNALRLRVHRLRLRLESCVVHCLDGSTGTKLNREIRQYRL